MLHKTDSFSLSQTLLCLYKFIIKSSLYCSRYQWWIHALMILSSFGSSCYILSPNPLWNSGSLILLLFWALINKTLMLDHFPAVSATALLDLSMVDSVLQSGKNQFVKDLNRIEKRIILPLRTDVCRITKQNLPCLSQGLTWEFC